MALFSYPVCTWLCQYVNMGVRKWLEKSAEKQKYKMRKTANPLSRKAFRAVSFSATKDSSSQASYRLRRAFSFHCKAHRALILLLLASKPQPLCWVAVWVRRFAAVSSAKSALRPRSFLPLPEKNVIRPLPCSSFPTATRCAGPAVGRPPCGRHFLCPRPWEK